MIQVPFQSNYPQHIFKINQFFQKQSLSASHAGESVCVLHRATIAGAEVPNLLRQVPEPVPVPVQVSLFNKYLYSTPYYLYSNN